MSESSHSSCSQSLVRSAIVSGAAQGIGKAIALRLAQDGLYVAINDIPDKKEQLEAVAEEICQVTGQRVIAVCGNVSIEADVRHLVETTVAEFGGLDVMVANAGVSSGAKPLLETSVEDFDSIVANNARGPFLQYKVAAEQMIKQGRGGRIIGASSLAGKRGFPSVFGYVAAKFAVRGMTQAAALELAQYNITVNGYAPGFIVTPLTIAATDGEDIGAAMKERTGLPSNVPMGDPTDISELVSYLAKPEAKFITGQTISVDGGTYFD